MPSSFTSAAVLSFSRRSTAFYGLVDVIVRLLYPSRLFPSQAVPWVLPMPFQRPCDPSLTDIAVAGVLCHDKDCYPTWSILINLAAVVPSY
jgi:hypothetical protein